MDRIRNFGESGIYMIRSKTKPDRIYIGSAVCMNRRWWEHISLLNANKHHSHKLQRHCNKYGKDDLEFSIIEKFESESREYIIEKEQYYLDTLKPFFNECKLASCILGIKQSEETCLKKSMAMKGKKKPPMSQETKDKISNKLKGKPFSEEHCNNLKGKIISEEHRNILKIKMKGNKNGLGNGGHRGTPSWNYGKKYEVKSRRFPVVQFNKKGNKIKEWSSSKEISDELHINIGSIRACCRREKKYKTLYGFVWRYKKDLI